MDFQLPTIFYQKNIQPLLKHAMAVYWNQLLPSERIKWKKQSKVNYI